MKENQIGTVSVPIIVPSRVSQRDVRPATCRCRCALEIPPIPQLGISCVIFFASAASFVTQGNRRRHHGVGTIWFSGRSDELNLILRSRASLSQGSFCKSFSPRTGTTLATEQKLLSSVFPAWPFEPRVNSLAPVIPADRRT